MNNWRILLDFSSAAAGMPFAEASARSRRSSPTIERAEAEGPAASAERLRPHLSEDMEIRAKVSASVPAFAPLALRRAKRGGGARLRQGYGASAVARTESDERGWRAPAASA